MIRSPARGHLQHSPNDPIPFENRHGRGNGSAHPQHDGCLTPQDTQHEPGDLLRAVDRIQRGSDDTAAVGTHRHVVRRHVHRGGHDARRRAWRHAAVSREPSLPRPRLRVDDAARAEEAG